MVGLAGLLGSGRTETARAIFGADPPDDGEITVKGQRFEPRSPSAAIAAHIAFVTEDRKAEGIIPEMSVRENLTLAALPTLTRMGIVDADKQRQIVDEYMRRFGIKAASSDQKIRELSGGNQQKVLLARWLCTKPELFIVDEPTAALIWCARESRGHNEWNIPARSLMISRPGSCGRKLARAGVRDGRDVASSNDELSQTNHHAMRAEAETDARTETSL